jgi:hypothetical protein
VRGSELPGWSGDTGETEPDDPARVVWSGAADELPRWCIRKSTTAAPKVSDNRVPMMKTSGPRLVLFSLGTSDGWAPAVESNIQTDGPASVSAPPVGVGAPSSAARLA